jgi:peptidoglycan/xylan/chitin deacetylase (PgdA/CDA1 family)
MAKEIFCAFGVDVDAVGGWLGSYGGEDSPCDISRGMFSGEIGSMRILKLFERWGLKSTWFVPGHSIETFPEQMQAVAEAGHEIGMHGYSHENPIAMTPEQEEAVMDKSIALIEGLCGRRPTGYVAPWWEFSPVSNELLIKKGIKYDHSLMHNDFTPYYVRVGDSWTKIDYSKRAEEWMKPLVRGEETDLIEIAASWTLDDLPPMMFIKAAPLDALGAVDPPRGARHAAGQQPLHHALGRQFLDHRGLQRRIRLRVLAAQHHEFLGAQPVLECVLRRARFTGGGFRAT